MPLSFCRPRAWRPPQLSPISVALLLAMVPPAFAGHGLNVIGSGTESLGMAGADSAVARDTAAVNINPAGLTQLTTRSTDVSIEPFHTGQLGHSDVYGNDRNENDIPFGVILTSSHAQPLARWPGVVAGIGLFAQGGTGFGYENMSTVFGTKDDLSSIFGVFKLAAGLGWKANEQLSLGATLGVSYASARQKLFPNTSVAPVENDPDDPSDDLPGFFGLRFDGGESVAPNFKLGLQYRISPTVTLGLAYNSKTRLDLDGATLKVNYESIGLGRVTYRDAKLDGFALPQEFGVGLAWQATPRWLLATELNWLDWSDALKSTRLRARKPNAPGLPEELQTVDLRQALNWRDLYAFSLGAAWTYDEKTILRVGFDRVRNPSPRETTSPLLNVFAQNEFTFGFSRTLDPKHVFGFALQYQLPESVRYTNPNLPFGPNAQERYEVIGLIFSLAWR